MTQVRTSSRDADTSHDYTLPRLRDAGWRSNLAFRSQSSRPNADGYRSALSEAHYLVLSTESLREVIEPVA